MTLIGEVLRRAEIGILHHHIARPYLASYAAEMDDRGRRMREQWQLVPCYRNIGRQRILSVTSGRGIGSEGFANRHLPGLLEFRHNPERLSSR